MTVPLVTDWIYLSVESEIDVIPSRPGGTWVGYLQVSSETLYFFSSFQFHTCWLGTWPDGRESAFSVSSVSSATRRKFPTDPTTMSHVSLATTAAGTTFKRMPFRLRHLR